MESGTAYSTTYNEVPTYISFGGSQEFLGTVGSIYIYKRFN
jgi:hypothetical protein